MSIQEPGNVYTLRTPLAHGFLTVTLLVVNVSQLRHLLKIPQKSNQFYPQVFWTLIASLVLQIIAAVCLLLSYWSRSKSSLSNSELFIQHGRRRCLTVAGCLENTYLILVFFIMTVNVFVALFISSDDDHASNHVSDYIFPQSNGLTTQLRKHVLPAGFEENESATTSSKSHLLTTTLTSAVDQKVD
jgi:Ninjurin